MSVTKYKDPVTGEWVTAHSLKVIGSGGGADNLAFPAVYPQGLEVVE